MLLYFIFFMCYSYVNCDFLQLAEGKKCSWNGVSGQCAVIYQCLSAIGNIENKIYPPICNYNNKLPIVCCTDCNLVKDTRLLLFNPQLGILERTGSNKARDKCLEYIHVLDYPCKTNSEVKFYNALHEEKNCVDVKVRRTNVDGRHTNIERTFDEYSYDSFENNFANGNGIVISSYREEFPHIALLGYGPKMDKAEWSCGGSVISERFILTAGHCLAIMKLGPVKYIALGIMRRSDPPELWQKYNVKRTMRHPEYETHSRYHDIALLKTDREISFNGRVRPACLHVDKLVDEVAYAVGWAPLGHKRLFSESLQSVALTRFSKEACSGYFPRQKSLRSGYNHTTQMCYGEKLEAVGTCEDDSGGPLQSQEHEQCVYTILGVSSQGRQCEYGGSYGLYTRVSYYVPWIEDIVWP